MKKLDGIGKDHEEFRLRLEKEKAIDLAHINVQKDIAEAQAMVISEALKHSKIEIIGGELTFFDSIMSSITKGKSMDRMVNNSEVYSGIKNSLLGDGSESIVTRIQSLMTKHGISTNDIKNITISALLTKMMSQTMDLNFKDTLSSILGEVQTLGIGEQTLTSLGIKPPKSTLK